MENYARGFMTSDLARPLSSAQVTFPARAKLKKYHKEIKILDAFQQAVVKGKFDLLDNDYSKVIIG